MSSSERILEFVNKTFITVDEGEEKAVNPLLNKVLTKLTDTMKSISPLFNTMFETCFYAGSSYDGLKIGKPDEYDIDLLLTLPSNFNATVVNSQYSGFVYIHIQNWNIIRYSNVYTQYRELENFMDNNYYLSHIKIKQWMESIVSKAINIISNTRAFEKLNMQKKMSGPAVTLIINDKLSIDLVGVIKMPGNNWPGHPVRRNPSSRYSNFLLVPKPPKAINSNYVNFERNWRLSFPQQEREMMLQKSNCKPVLRLLKKLRDTKSHNIPSYYIKTIFLWEIERRPLNFWTQPVPDLFLQMLESYKNYLSSGKIPYYWDANNNLLNARSDVNIANIKEFLEGMIRDVKSNPMMMYNYILSTSEFNKLCNHFN